ncbi:MAG: type II toxin-antitoxin system HicB family antitoxin [Polyangiales bacterium]
MIPSPTRTALQTYTFPLLVEQEEDAAWSVVFPDLPGCVTWGDSREDALVNAAEAATLHLEGLRAHGDPIPAPSHAAPGQEVVLVRV